MKANRFLWRDLNLKHEAQERRSKIVTRAMVGWISHQKSKQETGLLKDKGFSLGWVQMTSQRRLVDSGPFQVCIIG